LRCWPVQVALLGEPQSSQASDAIDCVNFYPARSLRPEPSKPSRMRRYVVDFRRLHGVQAVRVILGARCQHALPIGRKAATPRERIPGATSIWKYYFFMAGINKADRA
jgi:hypothetical protein